jgi:hypothetical protein
MSDTPRTDAAEIVQIFVNHPELRTNRVPTEFARQLERELADRREWSSKLADTADDLRSELAETAKDYRCLAELLDGHDATECRANLVKLKAELAAERALADRLAASLYISQEHHAEGTDMPYDEAHTAERALEAWKEARRGTN